MYFDIKKNKPINLNNDCVSFEDWMKPEKSAYSCAIHPSGFMVFLESGKIEGFNEYKEGDPYNVSKNINSNFQRRRFKSTIKLLTSLDFDSNSKILDLGCGEGHLTKKIFDSMPDIEIHGLDYSIAAIEIANKSYSGINFLVADGYEPPFVDEYFDAIILNNIWEHVPDPLRMLEGVKRILKRNGAVIISTPSRYRFSNLARTVRGKPITLMSKLHVTEYSVGQVMEQLKYAGFQVKTVYSETIKENKFLVHIAKILVKFFLTFIKSHHQLESTVFYLATKQ